MTISAFARLEINYNVREKARADRKYQNDYLQRCAQKEKGGEKIKIKIKQTEKKTIEATFEDSQPDPDPTRATRS